MGRSAMTDTIGPILEVCVERDAPHRDGKHPARATPTGFVAWTSRSPFVDTVGRGATPYEALRNLADVLERGNYWDREVERS